MTNSFVSKSWHVYNLKIEGHRQLLVALSIGAFAIIHLVHAQPDQQGFISLDCGLPANECPYTDSITGLTFLSDTNFIQSGNRGEAGDDETYIYRQYKDLRYFPDGIRNCYNLTVNTGINYLIRAGFSYGNYDGLNTNPIFDMYVGPNLWAAVDLRLKNDHEIIYMSKSNYLDICFVKTGETIPMISTLELRPLRNESYMTQFGPLKLLHRRHFKSSSDGFIRYPDDVFDRKWVQYNLFEKDVNTTLNVNSSTPFDIPEVVSKAAIIPINSSGPLNLYYVFPQDSEQYIIYLHFAEVQTLSANDTREFNIVWDENIIHTAYSPKMLQSETKYNIEPIQCSKKDCFLELRRTQRSTLPPLANAIETFLLLEFPNAETNSDDGKSLFLQT
ncbi:putative LRR receptor-like serine/threonine-protein kinase [Cardamine amara subsp. amara]|uniref:LRR receptor-like serine/threonine-protein kinase n=1 Tax=Cardamine amara subsp. amara TaxID=228776 RepID=A0ABD1BWT4_CARAN